MYVLHFYLVQSANNEFLSMKTRPVASRLSKCANVRMVKTRCFYDLPWIYNKNFSKIFKTAFFKKTIILTWIFFQAECSPEKRNTESSLKRCKSPKSCLTVDIPRDRSKTLKKREGKRKNENKSNNSFFAFTFLYRKMNILLENIFWKT